jgi:hypothetical protein
MAQWLAGWPSWGDGLTLSVGAVLVWALTLYLTSRSAPRRAPILAAVAMLCLTVYLGGSALAILAPDPTVAAAWLRRIWWSPLLAAAMWLLVTLALALAEGPDEWRTRVHRAFWPVAAVSIGSALLLGLLGVLEAPDGLLLQLTQVFALVCVLGAGAVVTPLWLRSPAGSPLKARFAGLCASAICFIAGGAWIVFASGVYGLPAVPGQVLLVAAMVALGWNMARYGALLAGEQVLADFLAFGGTMLGIVVLYGGIVLVLAPDYGWLERALPLLLLIMTTHVVVDTRGHLLDRLLYAPLVSTLRGQLRELANRVVRQPDPLSALVDVRETVNQILRERTAEADAAPSRENSPADDAAEQPRQTAELRLLVESALRHLNDMPMLSQHPLLFELGVPRDDSASALERAGRLRSELEQAIERLRPAGARPSPGSSAIGGWLHYLVLKEAYADGRPNKQVMQRYALSEGTFHRARRRAIDAVAAELAERAQRAAASSPSASSGPTRSIV